MTFNVDFNDFFLANVVNVHHYPILTNDCDASNSDVLNNSIVSHNLENTNQITSYHVNSECAVSPFNVSLNHNVVTENSSIQRDDDFVSQTGVNTIVPVSDNPLVRNLQDDPLPTLVSSNTVSDIQEDPYKQLSNFSKKNSKRMIFSHMNINSLAPKFIEIQDILVKGFSDIFFISETKLDDSFPNAQFHVPSFSTHRIDRNAHGGGLLCYVKETIPHKSRPDIAINKNGIESLVIQIKDNNINNFFLHIYI